MVSTILSQDRCYFLHVCIPNKLYFKLEQTYCMTRKKRTRSMVTFNCVRINSFAIMHMFRRRISLSYHNRYSTGIFCYWLTCVTTIYTACLLSTFFLADLNKWLHVGVFQALADKFLAEHSLLLAPLEQIWI